MVKRMIEIPVELHLDMISGVVVARKGEGEVYVMGTVGGLKNFAKENCQYCYGEGIVDHLLTPMTGDVHCFACLPEGTRVSNKYCAGGMDAR
jgi:hypothetical protein